MISNTRSRDSMLTPSTGLVLEFCTVPEKKEKGVRRSVIQQRTMVSLGVHFTKCCLVSMFRLILCYCVIE